jgi:TRAP-type C4-dicarboxylate transport system permease small subunit
MNMKAIYAKGLVMAEKLKLNKKGMDISNLYGVVLSLGLIAILLGVVGVILAKLMGSTGMTTDAIAMINKTLIAIKDLPVTWMGIIVTIVGASIVIGILVKSFRNE